MEQMLRQKLTEYEADLVAFTEALVAIPTENPPGAEYRACADLIARKLTAIGLNYTFLETPAAAAAPGSAGPGYCILSSYGTGGETLYFHGHYDVVPATSPAQFQPRVSEGKLFGRGSADMKSGLASMIGAIQALKACEIPLRGRIGLTIVTDEETGGQRGSRYLAERGLLGQQGIGMLMPEPTSGVVWNANRGAISLRVRIKGKPAHVGLHYEGVNAFEQMVTVANALLDYKQDIVKRHTQYNVEREEGRPSILMMGGQCTGGSSFNLVPSSCTFTVDRRINPEEDLAEEKQRLLELFDQLRQRGIDLEIEVLQEGTSSGVSETHPVAQALSRAIEQVMGKPPAFEMCPALTEIRFYADQGIPAFCYGPGLLTVSHGPEEFVAVEQITKVALVYALAAVQILGTD